MIPVRAPGWALYGRLGVEILRIWPRSLAGEVLPLAVQGRKPRFHFPRFKTYGHAQLAVARPQLLSYNGCYQPPDHARGDAAKAGGNRGIAGLDGEKRE